MIEQTALFQEIHQQPEMIRRLLSIEEEPVARLAEAIRQRGISHVVIAARGTSDNAARYAQYLLGSVNRLPVGLAAPSLFTIYGRPPNFGNALVAGISQSGQSPDIVSVLAEARQQGALTAAITNAPGSALAQTAEHVIDQHVGPERSVAATKTYTSQLAAIALLSCSLAGDDDMRRSLGQAPDWMAETLALSNNVGAVAERYCFMAACVAIGRGYNYATAFELALKLKELTYTMVEAYSSADFLHGPLALVEPRFPVILVAPSGAMLLQVMDFMSTLRELEAELLVISDDQAALAQGRTALRLAAGVPEWLSPLTAILPGQLLAMHLAAVRDYDLDRPRGLRKVTKTR